MTTLADLQAAVAATTTVQASALALIQGLARQLETLAAELETQGVDPTAVEALATTLSMQAAAFAAAVVANTPVVAPPPPLPPSLAGA
jgi:hypothetical protein